MEYVKNEMLYGDIYFYRNYTIGLFVKDDEWCFTVDDGKNVRGAGKGLKSAQAAYEGALKTIGTMISVNSTLDS